MVVGLISQLADKDSFYDHLKHNYLHDIEQKKLEETVG
jgi:hypothetical protein